MGLNKRCPASKPGDQPSRPLGVNTAVHPFTEGRARGESAQNKQDIKIHAAEERHR